MLCKGYVATLMMLYRMGNVAPDRLGNGVLVVNDAASVAWDTWGSVYYWRLALPQSDSAMAYAACTAGGVVKWQAETTAENDCPTICIRRIWLAMMFIQLACCFDVAFDWRYVVFSWRCCACRPVHVVHVSGTCDEAVGMQQLASASQHKPAQAYKIAQ